jgi:hypothetical protein
MSRSFADVDQHDIGSSLSEKLAPYQAVMHDDVGAPEKLEPPHGDQSGIARAAADQIYGTGLPPGKSCLG